jgi:NAD(P)-dependent dehydrogenase (short-subunit alcohol dehydrogenase family)
MPKLLEGKTVFITGGSRGIGRSIAIEAANEGALVIFTYHENEVAANEVVDQITERGGKAISICMALEDTNSIRKAVVPIFMQYKIDVLVNNAATIVRSHYLETEPEILDSIYKTNLRGPFELSRLIALHMIKNKVAGSIINITSDRDSTLTDELSAYQTMKAGLHMMSMILARTLSSSNIRVNTVAPGMVKTDMHANYWQHNLTMWKKRESGIPLQRAAEPSEIAKVVVFIASDKASYMTGSRIMVDGGRTVGKSNEPIPIQLRSSL